MRITTLLSITSVALFGCASNSQKQFLKKGVGREVDELNYTPFHQLEEELKSKGLEEIEYKTERELLPKGGRLHLFDKIHYESHPIVSVVASDGNRSFKCDDSEVSNTVLTASYATPEGLVLNSLGVHYDKSETEIECDITTNLNMPITFYMISTKNDTVSRYRYSK